MKCPWMKKKQNGKRHLYQRMERLFSRSAYSVTLTDTVKYVESSRKEITRTEKRLSVVDENDPSTYQIVRKEEAVEVQNEIPCEYQDEKGFSEICVE